MTRFTQGILQFIAIALQIAPTLAPIIPPDKATLYHTIIGATQMGIGLYAHTFNTDGTPQTTAFVPPAPKS